MSLNAYKGSEYNVLALCTDMPSGKTRTVWSLVQKPGSKRIYKIKGPVTVWTRIFPDREVTPWQAQQLMDRFAITPGVIKVENQFNIPKD